MPGRNRNPEAATDESKALIGHLESFGVEKWICQFDLHETTDTDATEFIPAKAARDGLKSQPEVIPDGFYLIAEASKHATTKPWITAMIEAVRKVTHIAPSEADGTLIGEPTIQEGVVGRQSSLKDTGLCSGVVNAFFATTTEVYPDSPSVTPE